MRYLLVGNGAAPHIADKARHADTVIQINDCKHRDKIDPAKMALVVLVNVSDKYVISKVVGMAQNLDLPAHTRILLSRNIAFYHFKNFLVWLKRGEAGRGLLPFRLDFDRPVEMVSFFSSLRLELELLQNGMPMSFMPSTGMIAWWWLSRQLKPGDSLDITGFTFEGWGHHPWEIERSLVKGIYPWGYRDDPSYEKRPS